MKDLGLIAISLVALLFFVASVVLIPLCIILKNRARSICTDALLVSSTLTFAVLLVLGTMAPTASKPKPGNALAPDLGVQAESSAYSLRLSSAQPYIEKNFPWLMKMQFVRESIPSKNDALKRTEDSLRALAEKNPNAVVVQNRLAVVLYESGKEEKHNQLSLTMPDDHQFVQILGDKVQPDKVSDIETAITREFPSGWYRQTALLSVYKTSDESRLAEFLRSIDKESKELFARVVAGQLLNLFLLIAGAIVVVKFRKFVPDASSICSTAHQWRYKHVYGCMILTMYAQAMAALIWLVIPHSALASTTSVVAGDLALMIGGLIGTCAACYFFLFKPTGTSFREGAGLLPRSNTIELLIAGSFTFLAAACLSLVSRFSIAVVVAALHLVPKATNIYSNHILQAVSSHDLITMAVLGLSMVIIGPFCEEIVFRAVLYTRLRCDMSPFKAAAVSAAIFSAWHMDLINALPLFLTGFVFALLYERYKSVVACTVAHGLYNSWVMVSFYLAYR